MGENQCYLNQKFSPSSVTGQSILQKLSSYLTQHPIDTLVMGEYQEGCTILPLTFQAQIGKYSLLQVSSYDLMREGTFKRKIQFYHLNLKRMRILSSLTFISLPSFYRSRLTALHPRQQLEQYVTEAYIQKQSNRTHQNIESNAYRNTVSVKGIISNQWEI